MTDKDPTLAEMQDAHEDDMDNPLRPAELRGRRRNDYAQVREIPTWPESSESEDE